MCATLEKPKFGTIGMAAEVAMKSESVKELNLAPKRRPEK